jgi:drug/metabolite transporter (DMT)-like permease
MARPAERPLTVLAVVQVCVLAAGWGGNAPALRYSLAYLPPAATAGLRFLIGLLVILGVAHLQRVSLAVPARVRLPLLGMAVLFTVQILLLTWGATSTEASRQALLLNTYPLFVPLLAHLVLPDDRLSPTKALGTLLAFLGVLLIFGERALQQRGALFGELLITASAVLLATNVVATRMLLRRAGEGGQPPLHPYALLVWQMLVGVPCFFAISVILEPQHYRWNPSVAAAVAYQGVVVAGLCFIGWTALLRHFSPTRLSVGFFLTPVFGALLGHLLLQETITRGLVAGGTAILAGLFVTNLPARRGTGEESETGPDPTPGTLRR